MHQGADSMTDEMPPRPVPLPVNFENIPEDLRLLNQWVLWRYVRKEDKYKWDKPPLQPNGEHSGATAKLTWSSFQAVREAYERGLNLPVDDPLHFDGIGFVPTKNKKGEIQIVFGDLDKCRDPETGEISVDAREDLDLINSYCEPSPSGTGLRFIAKGNPPFPIGKNGRKKGNFELYQSDHYLTITGHGLQGYPATIEKRPDELNEFYRKRFGEPEKENKDGSSQVNTDDRIIALAAQAHNSPKFLKLMEGEWKSIKKENGEPLYPSQSEADLALCELLAFYIQDPEQIDRIFRRSKLFREKWERQDYRETTIKLAIERTKEHYNGNGSSDSKPALRSVSLDDPIGAVGLDSDGTIKTVVCYTDSQKVLKWLSDCAVYIDTETVANNETEFMFQGVGAKDHRPISFTLPASSLADPRKFKAALINAFGACNRVGHLDFETVQRLTRNTRLMRRIEVPTWSASTPLLPGVGLADNVEYKLSALTPADVYDGDIEAAKECLRKLLRLHRYAPILVAAILGAPAFARWHNNDRFGLALWGLTGSLKTSVAQAALSVYGTGYMDDEAILKHGRAGATQVATLEVFANAGILPQLLDNVKSVDEKDNLQYISTIQAIIEGREKQRGKKDGGLRDSRTFACTPIITGEIRPEEASTSARVLNLTWTRPEDLNALSYIQENVSIMPVIGYHWLRFLANTELNLIEGFSEARGRKMAEFSQKRYTNPGRLATIYTLLRSVWGILCESPFGDVFHEFKDSFVSSLNQATEEQGSMVTDETEAERFLAGLKELLASNPSLVQSKDGKTLLGRVIGKETDEGLFLLPSETLSELAKIGIFTQKPTVDSLTKALHAAGKLVVKDSEHLKPQLRMNGVKARGWLLSPETCPIPSPVTGDAKNDSGKPNVSDVPGVSAENEREKFSDENLDEKELHKSTGDTGDTGDSIDNNNVTDSDLIDSKSVSGSVSGDQKNGDMILECGIGPHPRRDALAPGKKLDPKALETVRIIKPDGYRTQLPLPDNHNKFVDHLFECGEVVEVPHWRAVELIKRGIAEPLEAAA